MILRNSLRPSDAYMRRLPRPSLTQIMACRLVGAKPLSEAMLCMLMVYHRYVIRHTQSQWWPSQGPVYAIDCNLIWFGNRNGKHFLFMAKQGLVKYNVFSHSLRPVSAADRKRAVWTTSTQKYRLTNPLKIRLILQKTHFLAQEDIYNYKNAFRWSWQLLLYRLILLPRGINGV